MTLLLLAQLTTLVVFNATGVVVSSQDYALECDLWPKLVQTIPVIDPVEANVDDPVDPTKDCRALIAAQIRALPYGTGYRLAVFLDGVYGLPSVEFQAGTAPQPPPVKTCTYLGVTYAAPFLLPEFQWETAKAGANVAAMEASRWTMTRTKLNKKWQWWRAECAL